MRLQRGLVRRWIQLDRVFPLGLMLGVLALFATLFALASANPPDALWVVSVYDENDFDDIVAGTGAATTESGRLVLPPLASFVAEDAWIVVGAAVSSYSVRAPPV